MAVYFSTTRVAYANMRPGGPGVLLFWLLSGVGAGTALGGLLLFAARRYRGLPFPEQPGERLLVLVGAGALIGLIRLWMMSAFRTDEGHIDTQSGWWVPFVVVYGVSILLLGVLYLIAIVRTKILRWRLYFIVVVVAAVLAHVLPGFTARPGRWMLALTLSPPLLPRAFLVLIAVRDFLEGMRYRWTHWLGVGLHLWTGGVQAAWLLWWILFAQ